MSSLGFFIRHFRSRAIASWRAKGEVHPLYCRIVEIHLCLATTELIGIRQKDVIPHIKPG